jgi:hypothetical protein
MVNLESSNNHIFISNDKEHDTLNVQHYLLLHWRWFIDHGVRPYEHVFSNGCVSQFYGARAMFFVARYLGLINGCKMRWQFFGTSHGKGKFSINANPIYLHYTINYFLLDLILNLYIFTLMIWFYVVVLGKWDGARVVLKSKFMHEQL